MPIKKSYAEQGDACATAHALELVGDRWNYPVLRELMLAPKRFTELLPAVRGITPTVLTTRLRYLEKAGLVRRISLPAPARVLVYRLTEWGQQLDPIMQELGRWAQASPTRSNEGGLTPDATIQSMRTMAPRIAMEPPIELALHLVDVRNPGELGYDYRISWGADGLLAERGTNPIATARVDADSSTWTRILYEEFPLDHEGVRIGGQRDAVQRLVSQFAPTIEEPE